MRILSMRIFMHLHNRGADRDWYVGDETAYILRTRVTSQYLHCVRTVYFVVSYSVQEKHFAFACDGIAKCTLRLTRIGLSVHTRCTSIDDKQP